MSTTIIYAAEARVFENVVQLRISSLDNNLRPFHGSHRNGASFKSTFHELPLHDVEAAAVYFEGLARDYDGRCLREGAIEGDSGELSGFVAYRRWSHRYFVATKERLRAPAMERVCYSGVPKGLFATPSPRIKLKKGDLLDEETARSVIETDIRLEVTVKQPWGVERRSLGFLSAGNPCVFSRRSRSRGDSILNALRSGQVRAAEGFDSWADMPWFADARKVQRSKTPDAASLGIVGYLNGHAVHLERRQEELGWERGDYEYSNFRHYGPTVVAAFAPDQAAEALEALKGATPGVAARAIPYGALIDHLTLLHPKAA